MSQNFGQGNVSFRTNSRRVLQVKILNVLNGEGSGTGALGSGGGAENGYEGDYGDSEPPFTPDTSPAFALDTSNGRLWWYYDGSWVS